MTRILPSRKVVPVIIACLVAIGSVVFAAEYPKISAEKDAREIQDNLYDAISGTISADSLMDSANTDSDADGLKDWEETVWKTDPKNADSDGDGMSDGDEVAAGRNPAIKGPNDKLNTSNTPGTSAETNEKLSVTAKFGQEFFAKYIEARKSGNFSDEDFVQNFINTNNIAVPSPTKIYTKKDIVVLSAPVTGQTKAEWLRNYGNSVGIALASESAQHVPNELDTLNNALEKESEAELEKLNPIIDAYGGMIRETALVPAPGEIADMHVALLNILSAIRGDILGLKKTFSDPIIGLISVGRLKSDIEELRKISLSFEIYFERNGVVFEKTEYGSGLTNIK